MGSFIKLSILQSTLTWHNSSQNLLHFSEKICQINEAVDIILLPEMFTSGFSMEPQEIAETMDGLAINWMVKTAKDVNSAIAGSLIIFEDGNYYNRFVFVHPSGEINYYNKRHLFTLAGEDKIYKAGSKKVIITYKGWKICPQVCYDLRFPVWSRNVENYDVLLYVANWPKPRITAWDTLLKARAIENLSYTVGVNRIGVDANNLEYNGHSSVYNCLGEQIVQTKENREDIVIVTLEKNHISEIRTKLNFLSDKDTFEIK